MTEFRYSIVIPCFASGAWLPDLVNEIETVMAPFQPFELLLIHDQSPDALTWEAIQTLAQTRESVRGIDLLYHVGQFKATLCGLELAAGRHVITMDDDFQHPPQEIPKLISAMSRHPEMDCIMGASAPAGRSLLRNLGSALMQKILDYFYDKPAGIVTTSFRIMPMAFARTIPLYRIKYPQLGPLIVHLSKRIMNIDIEHHARTRGKSGYRFFKLIKETYRSIINITILPLRIFSVLGFLTAALAFSLGLYIFLRWFFVGISVHGYTSLILTVTFFTGMLLAEIGILGEYIGRIIQELTGMPRYQIRQEVGKKHETTD